MTTTPFDRRPSDADRAAINHRARTYLDCAVQDAYEADLDRWAREDHAPFPERGAIRARLEAELHVLCNGLGTWAAAHPAQFFNHIDLRIKHAETQIDRWDY